MCTKFKKKIKPDCEEKSVPVSLVAIIGMIMKGSCVEHLLKSSVSTSIQKICQPLIFNSSLGRRKMND